MIEENVVFEIKPHITSPILIFVILIPSWHLVFVLLGFGDLLTQTGGEDVLTAEFHTNSSFT